MQTPGFPPALHLFEGQVQVVLSLRQGLLPEPHRCILCDPLMCSANCRYSDSIPVSSSVAFMPSQTVSPVRMPPGLSLWIWPRPSHHLTSLTLPVQAPLPKGSENLWAAEQRQTRNYPGTKMMSYHQQIGNQQNLSGIGADTAPRRSRVQTHSPTSLYVFSHF